MITQSSFLFPLTRKLAEQPEQRLADLMQHIHQVSTLVVGKPPAMRHQLGDWC